MPTFGVFILIGALSKANAELTLDATINLTESITASQESRVPSFGIQSNLSLGAIDTIAQSLDLDQLMKEAAEDIPNLGHYASLIPYRKTNDGKRSECAKFPALPDLEFSNKFWQVQETSTRTLFLYSAYYDIRTMESDGYPRVRVLMVANRTHPTTTWCQLWFENETNPVLSKVVVVFNDEKWKPSYWSPRRIKHQPHQLACEVPVSHHDKIPISVSITEEPCQQATNNLKVVYENSGARKHFAVCVKGLDLAFVDVSVQLIEWIELLDILGVHKIFFYQFAVHPNIAKVLSYYVRKGKVHVSPITLPGFQPTEQRLHTVYLKKHEEEIQFSHELIAHNDCLYRNLYKYDYVVPIDIDEIMIPVNGGTWQELMEQLSNARDKDASVSYSFKRLAFDTSPSDAEMETPTGSNGFPDYHHMLRAVYPKGLESQDKLFLNTNSVTMTTSHRPLFCIARPCITRKVKIQKAQAHHFRSTCLERNKMMKRCTKKPVTPFEKVTNIWKYSGELVQNTRRVMHLLGFLS